LKFPSLHFTRAKGYDVKLILNYFPTEYGTVGEPTDEVGEPLTVCQHIDTGPGLTLELKSSDGKSVVCAAVSESFKQVHIGFNEEWTVKTSSFDD